MTDKPMCPTTIRDSRRSALELLRSRQNSTHTHVLAAAPQTTRLKPVSASPSTATPRIRVCVSTQNELLRETLCRVLAKRQHFYVLAQHADGPFDPSWLAKDLTDVLLLVSRER